MLLVPIRGRDPFQLARIRGFYVLYAGEPTAEMYGDDHRLALELVSLKGWTSRMIAKIQRIWRARRDERNQREWEQFKIWVLILAKQWERRL